MGNRDRSDFVRVVPRAGCGSVRLVVGNLAVYCTPDEPAEVTRGEWEVFLQPTGNFKLVIEEQPKEKEK